MVRDVMNQFDVDEDIRSEASDLLDTFDEKRHSLQHPEVIYAAACVLIVAQKKDYPLCLSDVAEQIPEQPGLNSNKKRIGRIKKTISNTTGIHSRPTPPEAFVPRYIKELNLDYTTQSNVIDFIERCDELNRHAPSSTAAAAIYHVVRENGGDIRQDRVSDATGVSQITIRNVLSDISE